VVLVPLRFWRSLFCPCDSEGEGSVLCIPPQGKATTSAENFGEVDGNNRLPGKFSKGTIVSQTRNRVQCLVHIKKTFTSCNLYCDFKGPFTSDSYVQVYAFSFYSGIDCRRGFHCIRESLLFTSVNLKSYLASTVCVPWDYSRFIPFCLPYD
jgi:hypothetical protein